MICSLVSLKRMDLYYFIMNNQRRRLLKIVSLVIIITWCGNSSCVWAHTLLFYLHNSNVCNTEMNIYQFKVLSIRPFIIHGEIFVGNKWWHQVATTGSGGKKQVASTSLAFCNLVKTKYIRITSIKLTFDYHVHSQNGWHHDQ